MGKGFLDIKYWITGFKDLIIGIRISDNYLRRINLLEKNTRLRKIVEKVKYIS